MNHNEMTPIELLLLPVTFILLVLALILSGFAFFLQVLYFTLMYPLTEK